MHSLFFSNSIGPSSSSPDSDALILENPESFLIQFAVPGFGKDDFYIAATAQSIEIKAEKSFERPAGFSVLRESNQEQRIEKFFRFRQSIEAENIEAVVKDGLIRLTVPKKATEHVVQVKAS